MESEETKTHSVEVIKEEKVISTKEELKASPIPHQDVPIGYAKGMLEAGYRSRMTALIRRLANLPIGNKKQTAIQKELQDCLNAGFEFSKIKAISALSDEFDNVKEKYKTISVVSPIKK